MSNTNVVRTAIASVLQTGQYIGKELRILPNSTLNQKLAIHADQLPLTGEVPVVKYVAIGCGGHDFVTGANGRKKWKAVHHTVRHAALYQQLPFVLRPLANDLTPTERLRYRGRRLENHGGEPHVAYYLRVLDYSTTDVNLELRHVEDGVTTSFPYLPTLEDLSPTPPVLVASQAVSTTGDYVASTAKVAFTMSSDDIQEFQNACLIIFGEEGWATISEMATVSAIDRMVTGEFAGNTQTYMEAIYAQITAHIASAWVTEYQTDGITMTLDVGNVEPLLTVTT